MTQVTRRGLFQASLCCAVLAASNLPLDLGTEPEVPPAVDPDFQAKHFLTQYISRTFSTSGNLAQRIVESAFGNAALTHLSPLLVLAVVAKESSFSPAARSSYGAVGLMQVVPRIHALAVARLRHPDGLWHPESNIETGTVILEGYVSHSHGNVRQALKRYSGGARQYPERVMSYWSQFAAVAYAPTSIA